MDDISFYIDFHITSKVTGTLIYRNVLFQEAVVICYASAPECGLLASDPYIATVRVENIDFKDSRLVSHGSTVDRFMGGLVGYSKTITFQSENSLVDAVFKNCQIFFGFSLDLAIPCKEPTVMDADIDSEICIFGCDFNLVSTFEPLYQCPGMYVFLFIHYLFYFLL